MGESWLRRRAEEAAHALKHKPRMAGIHPDDVTDAIEAVARAFAERVARHAITDDLLIASIESATIWGSAIVQDAISAAEVDDG